MLFSFQIKNKGMINMERITVETYKVTDTMYLVDVTDNVTGETTSQYIGE